MNSELKEIVKGIMEYQDTDARETIKAVKNFNFSFDGYDYIEVEGMEIRIIHNFAIDSIWEEELEEMLKDCYDIPDFLDGYVNYDRWVQDCKYDGLGYHFSHYDGSEYDTTNFYFFRTS